MKKRFLQILENAAAFAGHVVRVSRGKGLLAKAFAAAGIYYVVHGVTGWSHEAGAITLGAFLLLAAWDLVSE